MAGTIAIAGASGQLGTALVEAFDGLPLATPGHAELDFSDDAAVSAFLDREQPAAFINCTAFHNVDACERDPEPAFAMNALAVDRAAKACAARGVLFVTISTDYVFDGTLDRAYAEDDAPNPLSAYGASKLAGELLVRRHGSEHLIVRTSGVYGKSGTSNKGYTFIERVLQQAERGEPVRIVDNMTFSPSYAPQVALVLRDALERGARGTIHLTNTGAVTWYDFASYAFSRAGLSHPIERIRYDNFGSTVKRPLHSPLTSTRLATFGVSAAPPWQSGIDAYLHERAMRG
jgi:dTDP-4-dehydrorhamnose reductase